MRLIFLFCILLIISCFSLFNVSFISEIYDWAGMLVGLSSGWAKHQTFHISNIGHILAYCLFFSFLTVYYEFKWFIRAAIVFGIACTLELLQILTPGRQFSFEDIGYNLIGISLGGVFLLLFRTSNFSKGKLIQEKPNDK